MDALDIDRLETGSVIRSKSGILRVVRAVSRVDGHWKRGKALPVGSVRRIEVLKKKCSNYLAGYTFIDRHQLRTQYEVVGKIDKRKVLESEIHKRFIKASGARSGHDAAKHLSCCEAKRYD